MARPPVNYYNPSLSRPPENFRPSKLMNNANVPNRRHRPPPNFRSSGGHLVSATPDNITPPNHTRLFVFYFNTFNAYD